MKASIISAALIAAVTAQPPPPPTCNPGQRICGHELRGPNFFYSQERLEALVRASGNPATPENVDGIFRCNATSLPEFFHACLNNQVPPANETGQCNPQNSNGGNAVCRNGPVP